MSLFIGSAPRLAERHRLRCRFPSRHHAHNALLAPNSSPGVGRFLFAWAIFEDFSGLVTPGPPVDVGPRGQETKPLARVERRSAPNAQANSGPNSGPT